MFLNTEQKPTMHLFVLVHLYNIVCGSHVDGRMSKVECIRKCGDCESFAFNATTGICCLQSGWSFKAIPAAQHLGQVYISKGVKCPLFDIPVVNGSVSWNQAHMPRRGIVTCDDGFVNTIDDVTVQYLMDGSWQIEGKCVKHVWTNPPQSGYVQSVPKTVINGWSVCVEGTPLNSKTKVQWFSVNLLIPPHDIAVLATFRRLSSVAMNNKVFGLHMGEKTKGNLTMVANRTVQLQIMSGMQYYDLYVDGVWLLKYPKYSNLPSSRIAAVSVESDGMSFNLTRMDTWCFD